MPSKVELRWHPTESEREVFQEWKNHAVGYLVSSREGCNIGSIPRCLEEYTGDNIPLEKMGFRTINEFFYAMQEFIEVRTLNGKLFVFIRESSVPPNMKNIRQLVLGQAKDKGCKTKTGVIKRPTKNQTSYVRPEELLEKVRFILNKPFNHSYPAQRPISSTPVLAARSYQGNYARPNIATKFQQRPAQRYPIPAQHSTGFPGQLRKSPQPSFSSNITKYSNIPTNTTANTSVTMMPPMKPIVSMQTVGKENISSTSKPSAYQDDDDSWDDFENSKSKPSTSSFSATSSVTRQNRQSMSRMPRYPRGLIETDDESDNTSDDLDYYAGPALAELKNRSKVQMNGKFQIESDVTKVTIVNPPVCSLKPCSVSSSSNIDESTIVDKIATKTDDMQMSSSKSTSETTAKLPTVKNSADAYATREIKSKPEVTITKPVNVALKENSARPAFPEITKNEISFNDTGLKHMKGITLDNDDVLAQIVPTPTRDNHIVRMTVELPKIKFPPFLRGGSLQANISLKTYLAGVNNLAFKKLI